MRNAEQPKWYLAFSASAAGRACRARSFTGRCRQGAVLLAYGKIYSNSGAMTPGASAETADGMSEERIEQITGLMRREKYRFSQARRVYIPKKTANSALSACRHGQIS